MFIQYINKLPSKMELFDMLSYNDKNNINISEFDNELYETITAVCVYNGDRIIGMGRVKRESDFLCIQDVIVSLENKEEKEEIEKNIIINLINKINELKQTNIEVRDCLDMSTPKTHFYKRYNFLVSDKQTIN